MPVAFQSPHRITFWWVIETGSQVRQISFKKVVDIQILTFEELSTLTSGIEAVLNYRRLTAASSDPNNLRGLTLGDFLIGQPLTAIPEPFSIDYFTIKN